jgi:hypothetical protein
MYLLRRAWDYLKPADPTPGSDLEATEISELKIDELIEKQSGLLSSAAAGIDVTADAAKLIFSADPADRDKPTKTNIKQRVFPIKTRRVPALGPTPSDPTKKENDNLTELDTKIYNSFRANNLAAAANNNNAIASNILSDILDTAREQTLTDVQKAQGIAAAAAAIVGASVANADDLQYQANDELNRQKYECLPDIVFQYNVADKEKLTALRADLLQRGISTLQFRDSCVADSAVQLAGILKNYSGWTIADADTTRVSKLMMSRFTESWTPYLNCPASVDDESVDTQNRIFYNRVTSCIEALGTYSVFLSSQWVAYKATQLPMLVSGAYVIPTPPPPPTPPPLLPAPAESYYVKVLIPPYRYVIGPILDFQNIEGRIFIYVKCYDDDTYTTGTYFWVYRSQSEGLYRVFFKLIPNDSIEKGYDYTQATLVHFKLQLALNKYYDRHAQRGVKNPIVLNTLPRLNYFIGSMSYLQQPNFLDTFPNRANIIPLFYSIPGETNGIWVPTSLWGQLGVPKPRYCDRNRVAPPDQAATECCYVCLMPPTTTTPPGTFGMIGHYYMIDARYGPIIHKGFPMDNLYSGMANIKTDESRPVYEAQLAAYFPNDPTHYNYKFSRHATQYDTTYPYIFCFTTCCLTSGCSSFEFFLEPDRYKKTFWCQGFRDFTALMTPPPDPANPATSPVLSPVLHVVIGSMLTEPDFYLLSLRYNILNVEPLKSYYSANPRIDEYRKSTQVLMTLGTKERDGSIYQPSIDPYPRSSAIRALKALRDTINTVNIQYKRRIFSSNEENIKNQRLLVQDKVQRKIKMMHIIAYAAYSSSRPERLKEAITILSQTKGAEHEADIITKVGELRTKTTELLNLLPAPSRAEDPGYAIGTYSLERMGITNPQILADPATQAIILKAIDFIIATPYVAATAIIQYLLYPKEFEDDLTDYALLCLKKNWLGGMMDNAYEASTTMFGDQTHRRLHYFNNAGEFVFMGGGNFTCLNPSDPGVTDLYEHKSSFDEVKREATGDQPVTVLTLANIYRLDCYYKKIPGNIVKSMSIVYQVSSTIVHTRDLNPTILQAMDMQKIPLSFLPDLPEVLAAQPTGMGGGGGTAKKNTVEAEGKAAVKKSEQAEKAAEQKRKMVAAALAKNQQQQQQQQLAQQQQQLAQQQQQLAQQQLAQQQQQLAQQQQQQLAQQQLMEQISTLKTQQTYLEIEATKLGLTPTTLPGLEDLHNQVELIASKIHQIQLQEAQTRVAELLTQQQQVLRIIMVCSFLFSEYTSCATHRRVASYGGFFAGKMMEYFFSTHMQLPSFFKYFESYLKICVQYNTTALIYDADVPPYNLIELQRPGAPPPSFKLPFFQYFQKMKISFGVGLSPDDVQNARYIETTLQQKTADIKAISKFLTKDFMEDTDELDTVSVVSDGSTLSAASSSTNSSDASESFCSFDENSSISSSLALRLFLLAAPYQGSVVGDESFLPDDVPTQQDPSVLGFDSPPGGGNKPRLTTVATTKRNRKYKSRSSPKRKSKSKSRHKRNSKVTNKTFCRKRKSYLSRKPFKKQTLKKSVKR